MRDNQRKQRIPAIRVDFGKDQIISGISAPNEDGTVTFYDENGQPVSPAFVEVDATYSRKKGPKTLNRVRADAEDIRLDQNASLARYKHLFAVDTNTATVNSVRTSLTAAAYVTNIKLEKPRWNASLIRQSAFEFQGAVEPPEKIGWCEVLALIAKSALEPPIGIIVDAHLGDLKAINDRTQPICRNYFLPASCELIYASADGGGVEFIANAALADCDKTGSLLLKLSQQVPSPLFFQDAAPGSPYARFRLWDPPDNTSEDWAIKGTRVR